MWGILPLRLQQHDQPTTLVSKRNNGEQCAMLRCVQPSTSGAREGGSPSAPLIHRTPRR